ncbi:MAG: hypothetical protein RIQ89_1620 [Bacteroidota bacterium]|jgi:zinc protease
MQKFIITLLLIAVSASSIAAEKILPYPIHQTKLDNGLGVITVPFDSPGIVAFYIVVRVGSRDEVEVGKTGFAHFFEHMMFRGTEKYPKDKYGSVLKSTGASANANTSDDRTLYHMTGDASKLETMFELESDRFQFLKYSEADFKTEAGAVKGEYTKNSASPYAQLDEKISETAFTKHTYGHTTMGYFKDIVDMPNQYAYSIEFFNRFYRPEYCTIIVVGDATPERVLQLSKQYFGNWKPGNFQSSITPEPPQNGTRYVHLQKAKFPPYISLNYKGPSFSVDVMDMPALDVLSTIYFGETSTIYNKLVLEEQKVRDIGAGAYDTRDPGLYFISASLVNADDMQYVKDEIVATLNSAAQNPAEKSAVERAVMTLRNNYAMGIDNPSAIAESISHYVWLTGEAEAVNKNYENYNKITPEEIQAVAKKYFTDNNLTIATISGAEKLTIK